MVVIEKKKKDLNKNNGEKQTSKLNRIAPPFQPPHTPQSSDSFAESSLIIMLKFNHL